MISDDLLVKWRRFYYSLDRVRKENKYEDKY